GVIIDSAVAYLFFTPYQLLLFPPQPFFFIATLLHLLAISIHIYTSPFGAAAAIIAPQRTGEDCEKSVGAWEEG
ncbi:MAG: hypothetical protein Q9180_008893, partial [Flavoplaca navasiana]